MSCKFRKQMQKLWDTARSILKDMEKQDHCDGYVLQQDKS